MRLIQQRTSDDCVICCVAMVAGLSYEQAAAAFDDKPPYNEMHELIALTRLGIFIVQERTAIYDNSLIILTVPSLNFPGYNHRIVLDTRVPGYKVYDPQNGVPGKEFYAEYNDLKGRSEVFRVFDTRLPIKSYPRG